MILLYAFIVGLLTNLFILYYEPGLGFAIAILVNLSFAIYTMKIGKRQFDRSAFIKLIIIVYYQESILFAIFLCSKFSPYFIFLFICQLVCFF